MILKGVGLIASVVIVAAYYLWVVEGWPTRWFHAANAICGIPLVLVELATGAWFVLPVTGTFTVVGWIAMWPGRGSAPYEDPMGG